MLVSFDFTENMTDLTLKKKHNSHRICFNVNPVISVDLTFRKSGHILFYIHTPGLCCPIREPLATRVSPLVVSDSLQPRGLVARQAPLSMEFPRQEYWSG